MEPQPEGPPVAIMPRAPVVTPTPALDFPWLGPQVLFGMTCGLSGVEPFGMMARILATMGLPPGMVIDVCNVPAVQTFYGVLRASKDVGQFACTYMRMPVATYAGAHG